MGKISDNLAKVEQAMTDPVKKTGLGLLLKNAAIEAIEAGIGKPQWEAYMSMFADSEEQLKRLTVSDPANDEQWLRESRAYIVTNSICSVDTNTKTRLGVKMDELDKGLTEPTATADKVKNLRPKDFEKFVK